MSRGKATKAAVDLSEPATLHVKTAVKVVLSEEKARRMKEEHTFVSMEQIVAAALSAYFKNPEYDKILREVGLIE